MALLLGSEASAAGDEVFIVPRVPVQAKAESATAAKESAQSQGRRRAMDILLRRLTTEEDWAYLPTLATGAAAAAAADGSGKVPVSISPRELEGLESGFEVYGEKSSSSTYRAYITYRFKPDGVRRLLKNAHLPYSEAQTRRALVLPVLQTDSGVYLWEGNNPWMAAWKARPYTSELTPMVTPLGDVEDAGKISARAALALDATALAAIASHYNVSQVIVAHARLKQSDGNDQLSVRLLNGYRESGKSSVVVEELGEDAGEFKSESAETFSYAEPDENFGAEVGATLSQASLGQASGNFPTLAERTIELAIAKYASGWKKRTLIDHARESVLVVTAFYSSIEEWSRIRSALIATPLIGSVQVSSLSRRGAEMDMRVFGDPARVQVAMENQGIVFWTETGERWFMATPVMANQVRGRRFLREKPRRGLFGEDGETIDEGPVPASETLEPVPGSKIEQ
jgi:hypothetical protein